MIVRALTPTLGLVVLPCEFYTGQRVAACCDGAEQENEAFLTIQFTAETNFESYK